MASWSRRNLPCRIAFRESGAGTVLAPYLAPSSPYPPSVGRDALNAAIAVGLSDDSHTNLWLQLDQALYRQDGPIRTAPSIQPYFQPSILAAAAPVPVPAPTAPATPVAPQEPVIPPAALLSPLQERVNQAVDTASRLEQKVVESDARISELLRIVKDLAVEQARATSMWQQAAADAKAAQEQLVAIRTQLAAAAAAAPPAAMSFPVAAAASSVLPSAPAAALAPTIPSAIMSAAAPQRPFPSFRAAGTLPNGLPADFLASSAPFVQPSASAAYSATARAPLVIPPSYSEGSALPSRVVPRYDDAGPAVISYQQPADVQQQQYGGGGGGGAPPSFLQQQFPIMAVGEGGEAHQPQPDHRGAAPSYD